MNHYPSWRYHKAIEPKLVNNAKEDAALGKGWAHSPADHIEITQPKIKDDSEGSDGQDHGGSISPSDESKQGKKKAKGK